MIEGVAKFVGGKVLTAILAVTVALVVIWYWRLPPESRAALWSSVRAGLIWIGFVLVLPWALFFVPGRVVRADSNVVSGLVLFGYLLVEIAFALFLTGGTFGTGWQRALMCVGFLAAAVYNFVSCEFLARRSEDAL